MSGTPLIYEVLGTAAHSLVPTNAPPVILAAEVQRGALLSLRSIIAEAEKAPDTAPHSPPALRELADAIDGCHGCTIVTRTLLPASHKPSVPDEEQATCTLLGIDVTITPSAGRDRLPVVQVDTIGVPDNADGEPRMRLYLNDHPAHEGGPYIGHDDDDACDLD